MLVNVQFEDETEAVIISYFAGPQDPAYWKFQGTVDSSDPRWHTYYNSLPDWLKPYLPTPD